MYADVNSNFSSFPEEITGHVYEGVVFGYHLSFEKIEEFNSAHPVCVFQLDDHLPVSRRAESHGSHLYLVKMYPDANDRYPIHEVENGAEYRQLASLCDISYIGEI